MLGACGGDDGTQQVAEDCTFPSTSVPLAASGEDTRMSIEGQGPPQVIIYFSSAVVDDEIDQLSAALAEATAFSYSVTASADFDELLVAGSKCLDAPQRASLRRVVDAIGPDRIDRVEGL
jgi:hypothetical protein